MRPWLVLALAGCYNPAPGEGARCSTTQLCPASLMCGLDGVCRAHPADAAPPIDTALVADGRLADASMIDAAAPTCTPPPSQAFAAPILNAVLSSAQIDGTPSLTADRLQIFFKSGRGGPSRIWVATRTSTAAAFGTPTAVTEVAMATEGGPSISDDGLTLWFDSTVDGNYDIWMTTRPTVTSGWSVPTKVVELSSATRDEDVNVASSGLIAYLHSDRDMIGTSQIYRATRPTTASAWSTPVLVSELGGDVENPWISADDCTIYFDHGDAAGNQDLMVAARPARGMPFGAAQPLTTLDTGADDADAWLSPDQRYIIFATDRGGGVGSYDLYESTR